jgi:hypothetical protein
MSAGRVIPTGRFFFMKAGRSKRAQPRRDGRLRRCLRLLGPGLVTGVSDDDPEGIATYAVAGASLGYSTLWTAVITLPLMRAVELTCARIGLISGTGLTGALKGYSPRPLVYMVCAALLVARVFNIGADLAGMADAGEMLTGMSSLFFVIVFAAVFLIYRACALRDVCAIHQAGHARTVRVHRGSDRCTAAVARGAWRDISASLENRPAIRDHHWRFSVPPSLRICSSGRHLTK